ncbi:DNA-protecting protein DprA [Psychromonas sp. B3M02]|nr:DNA-protecting protein DprA [Psychromonas sp. B3M02]
MALDAIPALQKRKIFTLLSHYSIQSLFQLNAKQLAALKLNEQQIDAFLHPNQKHIQQCLSWHQPTLNQYIISYDDPEYPALLKQISSAPLLLFVKGNIKLLNAPQVAIVGSRSCTPYGQEKAHDLAQQLSDSGITVTSGLAIGVDGMAHRGALKRRGSTIAVLGTGLNNIYPKRHFELAQQVSEQGLLISEFWPDTPAYPSNFPRRNRIVSGLSLGTLVIEASLKSGSLITARYANEQNREVFALPGSIDNPQACGCLKLIQQGAKLVLDCNDIINEFPALQLPQIATEDSTPPVSKQSPLVALIDYNLTSFETLLARSGLDVVSLQNQLIELEINGIITVQPQGYTKLKG